MSTTEDINALLGITPSEIVKQTKVVKNELALNNSTHLEEKIISETNDIMDSTRNALESVLDMVQTSPQDAELVEAAASFVKAQTGLIDALSKLHLNKEKHKQNVELTKMRISADQQMNTENNQVKVLLSREEIMAQLMNDAKRVEVINVD
jgi:hypothetical protein